MLARIKSEIAYARGLMRAVSRMKVVTSSPSKTVGDYLEDWGRAFGDRTALTSERETLTYRQFDGRANRYARWARAQGLVAGDSVALMMPNRPEYLAIWFGFARVGVAVALINTNLFDAALAHSLAVVNAKAAVVDASLISAFATATPLLSGNMPIYAHGASPGGEPRIDVAIEAFSDAPLDASERPALSINDTVLFVYTSGTTGLPKAARITHSRVLRAMFGFSAAAKATPDDRTYVCLPMYHANGGLLGVGIVLSVGGSVYIREKFSLSGFWPDVIRENCTLFVYIGELCRYLLNAPPSPQDRAHKLRMALGNGLRPDIFTQFQQRFGIRDIVEFYASTEGNAVMINMDSKPGSVGRIPKWASARFPLTVVAYDTDANVHKLDASGHCIVCAPNEVGEMLAEIRNDPRMPAARFDGYLDAAATKAKILRDVLKPGDAWFRSGDLMRRDARGYFYFVDRIGDTFRWKGENVSTTEVAETMALFSGVKEALVYGVAVPNHDGRAGMAALVAENVVEFDLAGLRAYLAAKLPAYARPVFLRFRTAFDMTGTFKLKKMNLVEEGFDPQRIEEPLFFDDRAVGAYRRVDDAFVAGLREGTIQL